ncbi:inositol monophosphatase family protein [Nocardia cyriacigeorgica]|uniref:inositol monophosphatase family protein n=1 Tax=Nocardia cyriacigeorgica TaxID=135487 RepID=UPI000CEA259B|nr:inositol monophosphatase family protein [Nocardia cyriacigeorgica]AVH23066.1 inositol monophosphatase [Nocardia cyriacigeorgica]PPJ16770.1 inositol monophosphatase [Nocardia cyriacigeorgica]
MEDVPHSSSSPQSTVLTTENSPIAAPDAAELRRLAVELAEAAAVHVRTRRPEVFGPAGDVDGAVRSKSTPTDPVTVVDTETEQLIRTMLARLRPADHILGEEGGGDLARADDDTVVWVVDPIDGTVNFLYGIPAYAVSVAAMRGGRSIAGAVVDVDAERTYHAGLGLGAERVDADGSVHSLRCNPVDEVRMALVATGFGYGAGRRARQAALVADVLPRVRDIRRIGAAALDLCMVAEGRVDAHYEHGLNPWDWAAGALIATEAGARVVAPPATSTGSAGELFVAAAPGIADELLALLDELGVSAPIPEP